MKRLALIIIPALICGLVFTGCEKTDVVIEETSKKITVSLIHSDTDPVFEKTVILYESENYLIKTPLVLFLGNISYYFIDEYDKHFSTLERIICDGKTNNLLYSSTYLDTNQIEYMLADFLENGQCYFYDKKHKTNIKQVVVEFWGYTTPLAKSGKRKFYINDNVLFWEVVDW